MLYLSCTLILEGLKVSNFKKKRENNEQNPSAFHKEVACVLPEVISAVHTAQHRRPKDRTRPKEGQSRITQLLLDQAEDLTTPGSTHKPPLTQPPSQ